MSSERSKRRKVLEFTQWVRPEGTKVKYQAARHRGTRTLFGPARPSTARPEILLGRIGGGVNSWMGRPDGTGLQPEIGPDRLLGQAAWVVQLWVRLLARGMMV